MKSEKEITDMLRRATELAAVCVRDNPRDGSTDAIKGIMVALTWVMDQCSPKDQSLFDDLVRLTAPEGSTQ